MWAGEKLARQVERILVEGSGYIHLSREELLLLTDRWVEQLRALFSGGVALRGSKEPWPGSLDEYLYSHRFPLGSVAVVEADRGRLLETGLVDIVQTPRGRRVKILDSTVDPVRLPEAYVSLGLESEVYAALGAGDLAGRFVAERVEDGTIYGKLRGLNASLETGAGKLVLILSDIRVVKAPFSIDVIHEVVLRRRLDARGLEEARLLVSEVIPFMAEELALGIARHAGAADWPELRATVRIHAEDLRITRVEVDVRGSKRGEDGCSLESVFVYRNSGEVFEVKNTVTYRYSVKDAKPGLFAFPVFVNLVRTLNATENPSMLWFGSEESSGFETHEFKPAVYPSPGIVARLPLRGGEVFSKLVRVGVAKTLRDEGFHDAVVRAVLRLAETKDRTEKRLLTLALAAVSFARQNTRLIDAIRVLVKDREVEEILSNPGGFIVREFEARNMELRRGTVYYKGRPVRDIVGNGVWREARGGIEGTVRILEILLREMRAESRLAVST